MTTILPNSAINVSKRVEGPLISVIMPVHNGEAFLADAIESILSQSYQNLELIVIDDSQHSKCTAIASVYSDPRVKYLRGLGKGLASALNYGIERAQGEYIARMDADDVAVTERLSVQLQYLREKACQICGSWMTHLGAGNRLIRLPVSNEDIKFALLVMNPIAHPTVLGEAVLFKRNPYDIAYKCCEDYELWTRLAKCGVVFGNVDSPLLKYRVHSSQSTVTQSDKFIEYAELIAKGFCEHYLGKDEATALEDLGFGFRRSYSKSDAIRLCKLLSGIAHDRSIGRSVLAQMIAAYFRKIVPMNLSVFFKYLSATKDARLAYLSVETLNLAVQSLLGVSKDNGVFRLLSRFAPESTSRKPTKISSG